MANDKQDTEVFEIAGGGIRIWVDGGIHLKVGAAGTDPVELGETEALELGRLLIRLVGKQRN